MKYAEQILFIVSSVLMIGVAGTNTYDNMKNRYTGVIGVIFYFCMIAMLRPYDGPFKKNQWIWRALFQLSVIYNAFLVFLAFQNETEARYLMSLGDARLNKPVNKDMHTYDDNCEWEWINIWDNLDHYFLTHCLSWFLVSLMLRDAWVLNLWQLWDEVIELSWQHILPHFRECWWDHVLLDIILSNSLFIIVGTWVTRYFKMDQFDWLGRSGRSFKNWEIWTNPHHFGATIAILSIVTINFLDGFFLMNSLWTPPLCWMPISRLFFWFIIGTLAWKEQWSALEGKQVSGKMRYLCVWTIFIETFVSIKFLENSGNIQNVDTPWYILYPWVLLIVGSFSYYIYLRLTHPDKKPNLQINSPIKNKPEKQKKL